MKLMKSLFLSSAAGLVAMSGAQAADLPLKAKAVEYVKVCSLYGAGFYYIPGTDTCIKLGGYIRADLGIYQGSSPVAGNTDGVAGAQNRLSNGFTWRSRADLNIDTRTATEYGVVRTYMDTVFTWTSGQYSGLGTTAYSAAPPGASGNGAISGGQLGLNFAFIQFAGFTIGKAASQFSAPWGHQPGNITDALVGGGGAFTGGVNQFAYTAEFGNGVSGTVAVQDPTQYFQAGVNNLATAGTYGYGTSDYAGTDIPDIVGQLRVDQAWGLFQASVAAHENNAAYYGANAFGADPFAGPGNKWGWAGQLALSIKNIPTGPGDTINIQGVYTDGATRYNIQDLNTSAGNNTVFGGITSIGLGFAPDSVFAGGSQQLVQTWGMRGAFNHNWNPYWKSSLFGAYAAVSYNGAAKTLMCGTNGVGGTVRAALRGLTGTCDPDYNIAQIGANTAWTPVKNLTFTAEALYTMLDQKYSGTANLPVNSTVAKPGGFYALQDQNIWTVMLRAQRTW